MTAFSSGILIEISAQLGLIGLPSNDHYHVLDIGMLVLWLFNGISFLVYAMIRPAEFYSEVSLGARDVLFPSKS